jgi:hypothetical protein
LVASAAAAGAARKDDGKGAWRLCADAIAAHERTQRIPRHLLAAIAIAESGRWDAGREVKAPWPWTVNAEGEGRFYDTKAQAVRAVSELRVRDVRNIDVGCMQINLLHHPDAFADLDQAFEPVSNVSYGARHLKALFGETRSWQRATGRYHSATPKRARAYRLKVVKLWNEQRRLERLERRRTARRRAVVPGDRKRSEALNAWGRRMAADARALAAASAPPARLAIDRWPDRWSDDRWSRDAALLGGLVRTLRQRLDGNRSPGNTALDRRRSFAGPVAPAFGGRRSQLAPPR